MEEIEKEIKQKEKELGKTQESDAGKVEFLRQEITALRQEKQMLFQEKQMLFKSQLNVEEKELINGRMVLAEKQLQIGMSRSACGVTTIYLLSPVPGRQGCGLHLQQGQILYFGKLTCSVLSTGKRGREEGSSDVEQRPHKILKSGVHPSFPPNQPTNVISVQYLSKRVWLRGTSRSSLHGG